MNKHLFLSVVAACSLMLTTACSDEDPTISSGDTAKVSFNLQAEAALSTRTISDGNGADMLVYRVFDKDGNIISGQAKKTESGLTDLKTGHNITLNLAKGQTYKVAFWAQDADCSAYTVADNMSVKIDYNGFNNDETRDAFCKTVEIYVAGDMQQDVTLTRPFAQVNVGCTDEDWNAAVNSGITVATSEVTFVDAANTLNVLDGTVSGAQTVKYTAAAIPTETLKVDSDNDSDKEDFHYLSMSYILPNDGTTGSAKTVASASFKFNTNGESISLSEGLQNIPLQRNYRTNIVGSFLSSSVKFNVVVDEEFEGEYTSYEVIAEGVFKDSQGNYIASSNEGIANAILDGATTINLTKGNYVIPSQAKGKTLTISGIGAPEDVEVAVTTNGVGENCDFGLDGSTVTFEGITITTNSSTYIGYARCKGTYKNCVIKGTYTLYDNSKFENCTFEVSGNVYNIWTWGAKNIEFDGCTFNSDGKALLLYQEGSNTVNLTVKGCIFNDNGGLTSKKAAIEIGDAPYGATPTYNVTISETTVNGYEINDTGINTGTTLWGNKDSMPTDRLNVTVDGVQVY